MRERAEHGAGVIVAAGSARLVSPVLVDAQRTSFAGFDIRAGFHLHGVAPRPARLAGIDSIFARIEGTQLQCRGTFRNAGSFRTEGNVASLVVPWLDKEFVKGFRGEVRKLIDHPLLARNDYMVEAIDKVAGLTVVRFRCSLLPIEALAELTL